MEDTYTFKNKWESQHLKKKFRKSSRGSKHRTRKYYQTSNSSRPWIRAMARSPKMWEQSTSKVQSRIEHKIECHKKCRNAYYNDNECSHNQFFDSSEYDSPNHYGSVYLNDYIPLSPCEYNIDYDLQYALELSLNDNSNTNGGKNVISDTKPVIKKSHKRKKKANNSFETYWNEMQKDRHRFNKTLLKRVTCTGQSMPTSIHTKITKVLREYFILCNRNTIIKDTNSEKKKQTNASNAKPFSSQGINNTLRTAFPERKFSITTLANVRSFSAKTLVFHGTDRRNVSSIIKKGLIIGGTKGITMRNGSAYGTGVYCSPNIQTASGYSDGAIFVCAALNANKFGDIWVVPKANEIVCCYLIRYEGGYLYAGVNNAGVNVVPTFKSGDIAVFIPALGELNERKKYRNRQRRFSNKNK